MTTSDYEKNNQILIMKAFIPCIRLRHRFTMFTGFVIGVLFVSVTFITLSSNKLGKPDFLTNQVGKMQLLEKAVKYINSMGINNATIQITSNSKNEDFSKFHDLPQKCKVPTLDPYHPEVKPFMRTYTAATCDYPKLTEVTDDGILQVRDKNAVTHAKYCYMQRANDNSQKFTPWVVFYDKNDPKQNKEVKLTEDFVKVSITAGGSTQDEFHMYPVRKDTRGKEQLPPKADQLNIVFIMIDSVSHSTAERYLKKTLKKMKESPSTVIMNGHTIVGDGTTAQICAIFVGELENKLPEARKGYGKGDFVNRWPFIWKDFQKSGYVTQYSEDSPYVNTFNYRLRGFNEPPTDKYMRNFWAGASSYIGQLNKKSIRCSHQINFRYLKRFMNNYHDKPTFSFLGSSDLTHNSSPYAQLIDDDLVDLLEHLEKTGQNENTLLVIFGDHGDRSSGYRATMTGKLEERLPFMSFTLPTWFPKKYPDHFKNFQRNANLLTSHFDVYSTLRHLMTFPENKHKHKYGSSLFTDLSHLNRTCNQIGILDHWCSCLDYQELKIDDPLVRKAAENIISTINGMNAKIDKVKDKCATLKLDKIERAGIIAPGSRVQKFDKTFKDGRCDECGVKERNANYKVKNYEVVFTVSPSGGKYEATAVLDISKGTFTTGEGISRINLYKNQPHCIQKDFPYLRPYCYCNRQLDS
eukprot:TCONS_00006894-protein